MVNNSRLRLMKRSLLEAKTSAKNRVSLMRLKTQSLKNRQRLLSHQEALVKKQLKSL